MLGVNLVVLVLCTHVAVSETAGTCPSVENNVDYSGADVGNAQSGSANGCCAICSSRSGCGAFTWTNFNGGTCWLKQSRGSPRPANGAVSAVLQASPISPSPSSCSNFENNVDYSGADVGNAQSGSANGCCAICSSRSGCGAFTWTNFNGGTCWLKQSRGSPRPANGAVSAVLQAPSTSPSPSPFSSPSSSPSCPNLENNVDYSGADVGSARSASANGCCPICSSNNACGAFTWTNYNGGTCWMKSSRGSARASNGAISSVVTRSSSSPPQMSPSPSPQLSPTSSDPATTRYSVALLAYGDGGATTTRSSCCSRSSTFDNFDIIAEDVVATLMNMEAARSPVKIQCVLNHGDNLYWVGVVSLATRDARFITTFEDKFNGDFLKRLPFICVAGNHDLGGASYVCSIGNESGECKSTEALLKALDDKFEWQSSYKSYNNNRWRLDDHFYTHRIEDPATGVSIDIFNLDTNDADIHGATHICCQCYGYSKGDSAACRNTGRGHKYCCGGNTAMFDACMDKILGWGEDSRAQLVIKVKQSTATWKIVNTHYSIYNHYVESRMLMWIDLLRGLGVSVWFNGHTHGEKHDYSAVLRMHFCENGAGGGIQREPASGIPPYALKYVKNIWKYQANEYGFMSLQASKQWLKLQYHTADGAWQFGETFQTTKIGGVMTKHCWYIPADGGEGRPC